MNRKNILLTSVFVSLLAAAATLAEARPELGIVGRAAPSWDDVRWLNLPPEFGSLDVDRLRGQVVYLFLFQSWCPGCHRHGFPTLEEVASRFEDEDVVFVAVQTVFEGIGTNTEARALEEVESRGLAIPVGHAAGGADNRLPLLMRRYRAGGTPWTILLDRSGVVRWNGFQVEAQQAVQMIQAMLGQDTPGAGG